MKRIITIILTFTLIFSSLAVSSFAASSSSGKGYVRVKRVTYLKYKKAYKDQKKLKIKIKNLQKTIAFKQMDYEDAMDQYEVAMEENEKLEEKIKNLENENAVLKEQLGNIGPNDDIDELKHRLEQQEDINDWLWMSISSLGISYTNKTWIVPTEFPSTFMINGTRYTVRRE